MKYIWEISVYGDNFFKLRPSEMDSEEFPFDEITVYDGLYGVPSYIVWNCKPDKEEVVKFIGDNNVIRVMIGMHSGIIFADHFTITNVQYSFKSKRYIFYGVQIDYDKLMSRKNLKSIKFPNLETPANVIRKLFEINGIKRLDVVDITHHPDNYLKYDQLSFDKDMSPLDVIDSICNENGLEYYIYRDFVPDELTDKLPNPVLLIGEIISPDKFGENERKNFEFDLEGVLNGKYIVMDRITKISCEYKGLNPLVKLKNPKLGRVIWTKAYIGARIDGQMTFCMIVNGARIYRDAFLDTLEDGTRDLSKHFKNNKHEQQFIIAGECYGTGLHNEYKTKTFSHDVSVPHTNIADVRYNTIDPVSVIEDVPITSPFAGNEVGMLFPQISNTRRLLYSPYGKRNLGVIGPFFYKRTDTIPYRTNAEDFRLQLPGGWCLYVKNTNEMVLQKSADVSTEPTGTGTYIKFDSSGNVIINAEGDVKLMNGSNQLARANHTHNSTWLTVAHLAILAGFGITPPFTTSPTDASSSNTIKTKAD